MDVRLCAPEGLLPHDDIQQEAQRIASTHWRPITITEDIGSAVAGCEFRLYRCLGVHGRARGKWAERIKLLLPQYQVNSALMEKTGNPRVHFMHCLPAFHNTGPPLARRFSRSSVSMRCSHRGGLPPAIVFDRAENRMHTIRRCWSPPWEPDMLVVAALAATPFEAR